MMYNTMATRIVKQHSAPSCSLAALVRQPSSISVDDDIGVVAQFALIRRGVLTFTTSLM